MDVCADGTEEVALERARVRWRATGDRVWSIAVVDGEGYRRVAGLVGGLLADVRARTPTLESLLALDADPTAVLDRWAKAAGSSPMGVGALFEAACAVRGDELLAARARDRRIATIAAARATGERWVVLDATAAPTHRTVEMHLASGLALVATADPYAGSEPYGLGETVLDPATGDPLPGQGRGEISFADPEAWRAELDRRRAEIDSRLDGGDRMLSDKR